MVRMSSTSRTRSPGSIRNPRRNSRRAVPSGVADLLGEDRRGRRAGAPVSKARTTPPVVGPGDEVDRAAARRRPRCGAAQNAAQLARGGRVLEHEELLEVAVRVAAALEQEVALPQRAGAAEQRLRPSGDRRARGGVAGLGAGSVMMPCQSTARGAADAGAVRPPADAVAVRAGPTAGTRRPSRTGAPGRLGSAVPMSGRYESRPRRAHSAASSSTSRTGSVGSAKIAVPDLDRDRADREEVEHVVELGRRRRSRRSGCRRPGRPRRRSAARPA